MMFNIIYYYIMCAGRTKSWCARLRDERRVNDLARGISSETPGYRIIFMVMSVDYQNINGVLIYCIILYKLMSKILWIG